MVDHIKIFLGFWTRRKFWLLFVILCACMYEGPKTLGMLGPTPLECGAWLIPRSTLLSHVCYHTKFGRCRPNHLGTGRSPKKDLGDAGGPPPWDASVVDPRNMLLPHLCYDTNFSHSRSNHMSIIMEICQKILTPHVLPFKVTQSHWNWHGCIGYLGLPISDPRQPWAYLVLFPR